MPFEVDFDTIPDGQGQDGPPPWEREVPEGWYEVRIAEVKELESNAGTYGWGLKLKTTGSPFVMVDDAFWFTPKALNRVRILYKALGLPHHGKITCDPKDVDGRRLRVYLLRKDEGEGLGMKVEPWDGYKPLEEAAPASLRSQAPPPARKPAPVLRPFAQRPAPVQAPQEEGDIPF